LTRLAWSFGIQSLENLRFRGRRDPCRRKQDYEGSFHGVL
jgi:hypothetical protein